MSSTREPNQITMSVYSGPSPVKSQRSGYLADEGFSDPNGSCMSRPDEPYLVAGNGGASPPIMIGEPMPQAGGAGGGGGGGGSEGGRRRWRRGPRPPRRGNCPQMQLEDGTIISDFEDDAVGPREHKPVFCVLAFLGCCLGFIVEIKENGWAFQPFMCSTCADGSPCHEDGTPGCEANILFGPSYDTMERCGGKLDTKIYDDGEWWRVVTCNWLHGGLFHLLMNMIAVYNLGFPLERRFGWWRIGSLYILAGLFGTMVSVVFLPGVLSVGASASVFGLIGACWADVILNYCARCTLKDANFGSLLISTIVNVMIGLTPFVDNFMHMGGFLAGIVVGLILFSKRHPNAEGLLVYRQTQRNIIFLGVLVFVVLFIATIAVAIDESVVDNFRRCSFCKYINCVEPSWFSEDPWWDCDVMARQPYCVLANDATPREMFCFCTAESCDGLSMDDASDANGQCTVGTDGCEMGSDDSYEDTSFCQSICS